MAHTTEQMTAEQLASMPDNGGRCELVEGVLHMMSPAGGRHGRIADKLSRRIGNHVEQKELGETFAAETGFLLRRNLCIGNDLGEYWKNAVSSLHAPY
ncbi:MAG: Uma2 family endonuclease [Pirellulaceae bacterium]